MTRGDGKRPGGRADDRDRAARARRCLGGSRARASASSRSSCRLPSDIFVELSANLPWYLGHAWYTLITTMAGFAVAVVVGIALAVVVVESRLLESTVYALIVGLNSVPKVAVAPLFVVWLGTGYEPKIAIAFLIAVFAMVIDTVLGLRSVPSDVIDLARSLRGSRLDVLFRIACPARCRRSSPA